MSTTAATGSCPLLLTEAAPLPHPILKLPDEVLLQVLDRLSVNELLRAAQTCKWFQRLAYTSLQNRCKELKLPVNSSPSYQQLVQLLKIYTLIIPQICDMPLARCVLAKQQVAEAAIEDYERLPPHQFDVYIDPEKTQRLLDRIEEGETPPTSVEPLIDLLRGIAEGASLTNYRDALATLFINRISHVDLGDLNNQELTNLFFLFSYHYMFGDKRRIDPSISSQDFVLSVASDSLTQKNVSRFLICTFLNPYILDQYEELLLSATEGGSFTCVEKVVTLSNQRHHNINDWPDSQTEIHKQIAETLWSVSKDTHQADMQALATSAIEEGNGELLQIHLLLFPCILNRHHTFLHTAAQYGREEIVRALLDRHHIDPRLVDEKDRTADQIAHAHGHDEIATIITEAAQDLNTGLLACLIL